MSAVLSVVIIAQPLIVPNGENAADVLRTGHRLAIELRKVGQRRQAEPARINIEVQNC